MIISFVLKDSQDDRWQTDGQLLLYINHHPHDHHHHPHHQHHHCRQGTTDHHNCLCFWRSDLQHSTFKSKYDIIVFFAIVTILILILILITMIIIFILIIIIIMITSLFGQSWSSMHSAHLDPSLHWFLFPNSSAHFDHFKIKFTKDTQKDIWDKY